MADRYQNRPFPADDDYDRGDDPYASARAESDPLAELARLIGQTDPFLAPGRANRPVPPRGSPRDQYQPPAEPDEDLPAGPPPWIKRAARYEVPQQDFQPEYPSAVHPLQRAAARAARDPHYPDPHYDDPPPFADGDREPDPSRYDEALYGEPDAGAQQHDPAYADDAYYQDDYDDGAEDQVKRRGGMVAVFVVLALAVVGTGAALAYRTYVGSPRSGDPPIIRADSTPTKIMPAPSDGTAKLPDRMVTGDATEKIVPREEVPVDVNARSGPRVVFPPLNQNGNPPSAAGVLPGAPPPASAGNGTLPNTEPRKVKTLSVHGDQPDGAAVPVASASASSAKSVPAGRMTATPAPGTPRSPPSAANASANAPLSLSPQGTPPGPAAAADARTRVAATNPAQTEPAAPSGAASSSGYLVQVSSQRNEADAQASFRALQGKFPAVLGSHEPVIKRADLGDKGVYYRAMVGPFGTSEEASHFCGSLKTAGGQCVVQRN
ncbi:MAG TPA: SPOR domain-containing protein [Bradyrhizobium sp.]|nr:SPOR domain-containing protein [Bradyrhizobium sp.]